MKKPSRAASSALTLRGRAIGLLARREHSRAELARKLAQAQHLATPGVKKTDEADETPGAQAHLPPSRTEIDQVLDQLEGCGLLSDARAAAAYVRGHAARFGTAKLAHSLRARGIDSELIEASLAQEVHEDEATRAAAIWHGKFGDAPRDAREWARQARFLQGRGFSGAVIRQLLNRMSDLPENPGDTDD
jgi:regulatory protein